MDLDDDSIGADTMSSSSSASSYVQHRHYNEEDDSKKDGSSKHQDDDYEQADDKKSKKNTCATYLQRFDQLIVRPILIHKYDKDRKARAQEFYEMF